jgi:hypothetical protein
MIAIIVKTFQELVALLPAAVARALLLVVLLVAGGLHYTSTGEIKAQRVALESQRTALETLRSEVHLEKDARQLWVKSVEDLSGQVQAWRRERDEDRRELLRELRRRGTIQ